MSPAAWWCGGVRYSLRWLLEGVSPKRPWEGCGKAPLPAAGARQQQRKKRPHYERSAGSEGAGQGLSRCAIETVTAQHACGFCSDAGLQRHLSGVSGGECQKHLQWVAMPIAGNAPRHRFPMANDAKPLAARPLPLKGANHDESTQASWAQPSNSAASASPRAMPATQPIRGK